MLNDINFATKGDRDGSEGVPGIDLCPALLEEDINAMNEFVYDKVKGVRRRCVGMGAFVLKTWLSRTVYVTGKNRANVDF